MRKCVFLILISLLAGPLFAQTTYLSNEISVANYDDAVHSKAFPGVVPAMKRFAAVVTNSSNQPIIAARVQWKWIDANGKPGDLTQEHNSFVTAGGPVANGRSMILILPNGTATQAGRATAGGYLRLPPPMLTAPTVTVSLDVVIMADGQVIGPDETHLADDLKVQAAAASKARDIIQAAKAANRDPKADLQKAVADTSLSRALRSHLAHYAFGIGNNVPQIQLPNFYRK